MTQKNEKPVYVDARTLTALSKSAIHAYVQMLTQQPEFIISEMQAITGYSMTINYGIVQEWTRAGLIDHTRPAPGRMATYVLKQHFQKNLEVSLTTTDLTTNLNKKGNEPETLPNVLNENTIRLANTFRISPEFLETKIVEREQQTGKPRDYAYIEMVLNHAKRFANKSFEGLFYYLYVRIPYFRPSLSFYTQDISDDAAMPAQFATTRQPVATEQKQAQQDVSVKKTPYNATVNAPAAWNTNPAEDLRRPLKEDDVMQQHYKATAAPLTENQEANEAQAMRDLKSSLNNVGRMFAERRLSRKQAQDSADSAFKNYLRNVENPSPTAAADLLALRQKAADLFQPRDAVPVVMPNIHPVNATHAGILEQFATAEAKEKARAKVYGRINAHRSHN